MKTGVAAILFAVASGIALAGACSPTPCTPEEHDLGGAARLTVRRLATGSVRYEDCARPRTEVIGSEADLRKAYEEAKIAPDGGVDAAVAAVDFARERVILREGPGGEGVSWAVARDDVAILGLLACGESKILATCYVEMIAVPALVARAETRSCETVGCGR